MVKILAVQIQSGDQLSLTRVINSQSFRVWQTSDGKQHTSWRELQATLAEKDATR